MPRADPGVTDLGSRSPLGLIAVLWLNALVAATLGGAFVWSALSVAGGSALYLACAALCIGFAGWLVWMSHRESRWRVLADGDGIALRTRGRSRHAWTEIDRFEVRTLFSEGVVRIEEVDGHCAVMVLLSGERIALRALRTHAPFRGCSHSDISARVRTLNEMHEAAGRARGGEATVLESGARC